jgi:hypothetical protein
MTVILPLFGDRRCLMAKMRTESRRKLVEFDEQTWHALNLLSREAGKTFQQLADEAFGDLLQKQAADRFERGAAGEREGSRKTASESKPISLTARLIKRLFTLLLNTARETFSLRRMGEIPAHLLTQARLECGLLGGSRSAVSY